MGLCCLPDPPDCIWNKPNLFVNASLCSDTFQYAKIFCEALFNFYLERKQRFSLWSFTENASFISFHGGI